MKKSVSTKDNLEAAGSIYYNEICDLIEDLISHNLLDFLDLEEELFWVVFQQDSTEIALAFIGGIEVNYSLKDKSIVWTELSNFGNRELENLFYFGLKVVPTHLQAYVEPRTHLCFFPSWESVFVYQSLNRFLPIR